MKTLLNIVLYGIGILGIIAILIIFHNHIDNTFTFYFVIGYIIYLVIFLVYYILATLFNIRHIKWKDIQSRLIRFIITLAIFILLDLLIALIRHKTGLPNLYKHLPSAIVISIASAFADLPFIHSKSKSN